MHTKENADAGQRVLVVDDEKNIRLTLSRALASMGLETVTAADGREVLALLEEHSFGLVLLDLKMPGPSGLDVLPRLRTVLPDVPVVILTAHGTARNAVEAMKRGATDIVEKPFTPEEFRALVRRVGQVEYAGESGAPAPPPQMEARARRAEPLRGSYRVVVPVADPGVQHYLLRLAAASAHVHQNGELIAVHVTVLPSQTPLATARQSDSRYVQEQRTLLGSAKFSAQELGVPFRARAIAGRSAEQVVLKVLREERADHVLMRWQGPREQAGGPSDAAVSTIAEAIAKEATCEVTLVNVGQDERVRRVAALVNDGPHAPAAARRAFAFAQSAGVSHLALVHARSPANGEEDDDAEETGREMIHTVAERAGLLPQKYEPRVVVAGDVPAALLHAAEDYDTICVGASRSTAAARQLFGSIPAMLVDRAAATVAVVRRPTYPDRTVLKALNERWTS